MAIYNIRKLFGGTPPPVKADGWARDQFKYAANRLRTVLARVDVADVSVSAEGAEFWADVEKRMRQISENGELQ